MVRFRIKKRYRQLYNFINSFKTKKYEIKYISIHNPAKEELNLLKNTLELYKKNDIEIIISGNILTYKKEENISNIFYKIVHLIKENNNIKPIYLEKILKQNIGKI